MEPGGVASPEVHEAEARNAGPFSAVVMEHFHRPRHVGELDSPTGEGWAGSADRGRFMRFQVRVEGGVIRQARYQTYGCAPAIAAGSVLAGWVAGRPVEEALALQGPELAEMLGGLPPQRLFCADLALEALRGALAPGGAVAP